MRRPGLARPLSCFSVLLASNNEPARLLGGLGFRPGSHPPPLFSPHSYIRAGGSPPSPGGNCHRRGRRTMSGCTWRPNLLKISWGTGSTKRGSGTSSGKAKGGPGRTADGDQGASSEGSGPLKGPTSPRCGKPQVGARGAEYETNGVAAQAEDDAVASSPTSFAADTPEGWWPLGQAWDPVVCITVIPSWAHGTLPPPA